jgi:hypothetical protein
MSSGAVGVEAAAGWAFARFRFGRPVMSIGARRKARAARCGALLVRSLDGRRFARSLPALLTTRVLAGESV